MNVLVRRSAWFTRLVLAAATLLFSLIGIRYVVDPIGAVAPHHIVVLSTLGFVAGSGRLS